jgi:hypothetical protein
MGGAPRFAVAGYLCFDLGGRVRDSHALIAALEETGWPARRWEAGEAAHQLAYKVSHVPTVFVDERTVELDLPAPARPRATRTIKAFPSGVLSLGYLALQLLFAATVAASIAALVPPTVHRDISTTWSAVTWTALTVVWLLLVVAAILVLRRRLRIPALRPPTAPEWLERQPRPGSPGPPGRTPPERPDTGRDPPPG